MLDYQALLWDWVEVAHDHVVPCCAASDAADAVHDCPACCLSTSVANREWAEISGQYILDP